jgi:hypothetical protein
MAETPPRELFPPPIPAFKSTETTLSDRPLILYAYKESANAIENIDFFLNQGLHSNADFVFILNGNNTVRSSIPTNRPNVRVIERPNTCFDLGAYGEVLRADNLWERHRHFILLNASLRGPFLPTWSRDCWTDLFLRRLRDKVKVSQVFVLDVLHPRSTRHLSTCKEKADMPLKARRPHGQLLAPVPRPVHALGDRPNRYLSSPLSTAQFLNSRPMGLRNEPSRVGRLLR